MYSNCHSLSGGGSSEKDYLFPGDRILHSFAIIIIYIVCLSSHSPPATAGGTKALEGFQFFAKLSKYSKPRIELDIATITTTTAATTCSNIYYWHDLFVLYFLFPAKMDFSNIFNLILKAFLSSFFSNFQHYTIHRHTFHKLWHGLLPYKNIHCCCSSLLLDFHFLVAPKINRQRCKGKAAFSFTGKRT